MTAASAVQQPGRAGDRALPLVIQGGMGVAVSSWRLASEIARAGQLGVVAGTALDLVLARRLQDGDNDGAVRRALAAFPVPEIAERIVTRYFRPGGRPAGTPYAPLPRLALRQTKLALELGILGNFVEVWLAKEGHDGLVGINFLEKVQMATPTAAYGAMLAGVDYVLMGAGIPATSRTCSTSWPPTGPCSSSSRSPAPRRAPTPPTSTRGRSSAWTCRP